MAGARETIARVDLTNHAGAHPRVGAVDVAPIVYLRPEDRGAAVAEALVLADRLGHELQVPVYLYGDLAGGRTRAELRRGGIHDTPPDYGPPSLHPTAGATSIAPTCGCWPRGSRRSMRSAASAAPSASAGASSPGFPASV